MARKQQHYFEQYKELFVNPALFFHNIRKESELKPVVLWILVLGLFSAILSFLFSLPSLLGNGAEGLLQLVFSAIMIVLEPLFSLLAVFFGVGVLYLLFRWLLRKDDFTSLFKVVGYSRLIAVPYTVLSAFLFFLFEIFTPGNVYGAFNSGEGIFSSTALIVLFVLTGIISIASAIHVFYATIMGLEQYEKVKTMVAIGMLLLSLVVSIILILLISGVIAGAIFAALAAGFSVA